MKQLLVVVACAVWFAGLTGCQRPVQTTTSVGGVEVVVEGGGKFPEFLAGRWIADTGGWEIVFEPDGTISSAIVGLDHVEIVPGQSKSVPRKNGGKDVHKPGVWTVQYSSLNREMAVEIVMDHTVLYRSPIKMEGKTRDVFVGEVSDDGRIWETEWFTFPDYIVYDPEYGPEPKTFKLPPDKSHLGPVIFEKF